MRILVVSDTHGDLRSLIKAVDAQRKAEIIVHCGDGEEQQRIGTAFFHQRRFLKPAVKPSL